MEQLRFGTDGWRDIIADRFTFANVRRCAQAYAEHLLDEGSESVVVGFDTRFGGEAFAGAAANVLAANGLDVLLSATFVPTPAVSHAVTQYGAGGAVMLTASHNPPAYNGFKIKGPYAGSATGKIYDDVARRVARIGPGNVRDSGAGGTVNRLDFRSGYFEALRRVVNLDALQDASFAIGHDPMGGAAAGWLASFVRYCDLPLRVEQLRKQPDPLFHGVNPEPLPPNLEVSAERARQGGLAFIAATDGDGDRIGVVLPDGSFFNSHQIFAVLLDLLAGRGGRGRVVKTFTVSRLVERLARSRGLEVCETPVGFKYIVEEMLKGDVLIAGEESGGIGVQGHLPERDGILCALLLVEAVARAGVPLPELFAALEREASWRHAYDRADLELEDRSLVDRLLGRLEDPPSSFAGLEVSSVERRDGVKLNLGEDSWLLFRPSGTEPLLRVYAEAPDPQAVGSILAQAQRFVQG